MGTRRGPANAFDNASSQARSAKKRNENWHHGEAPALTLDPVAPFFSKNVIDSARADERQEWAHRNIGPSQPVDIRAALATLTFLPNRTPNAPDYVGSSWADTLANYRDGGVYAAHYAGPSEWQRHRQGHEFVMVIAGATTVTLHTEGSDHDVARGASQLVIVPQGIRHRFDTPDGAQIMTIAPHPYTSPDRSHRKTSVNARLHSVD